MKHAWKLVQEAYKAHRRLFRWFLAAGGVLGLALIVAATSRVAQVDASLPRVIGLLLITAFVVFLFAAMAGSRKKIVKLAGETLLLTLTACVLIAAATIIWAVWTGEPPVVARAAEHLLGANGCVQQPAVEPHEGEWWENPPPSTETQSLGGQVVALDELPAMFTDAPPPGTVYAPISQAFLA